MEATQPKSAYTIAEACHQANISRSFYYKLHSEGKAPKSIKLGQRRLIRAEALNAWLENLEAEQC